jgi:DNA ligase-associated metallophosphoesterase
MGELCVLRCSGALWLPDHRTLVAGDLHLEKGSAFAARGQMLPPYDSRATLDRLEAEIAELKPERVVLLGDSFHDSKSIGRMAEDDRTRLDRLAFGRDWIWLEGNHDREALTAADADVVSRLPGRIVGDLRLGALFLTHEPTATAEDGEVAGHLHPCARVVAHGRMVRRPCFVTDGRRLILPAFGAFTGGLNVLDAAIAGLFAERPMAAALGKDRVHALAWAGLV